MSSCQASETGLRPFDPTKHCLDGGTFVTNLADEAELIEEAVRIYGDPRLIIHDKPSLCGAYREKYGWKSLHYLGDEPGGGSWGSASWGWDFWPIVEQVRARHREWLKLKDFAP